MEPVKSHNTIDAKCTIITAIKFYSIYKMTGIRIINQHKQYKRPPGQVIYPLVLRKIFLKFSKINQSGAMA